MKIFIFEHVESLKKKTNDDDPSQSVVIIAKDINRANEMANEAIHIQTFPMYSFTYTSEKVDVFTKNELENVISYDLKGEPEEKIFVFPNIECC